MRGLTDRKTDLGNDEIHQLRTAVVNGIADSEHRDFPHYITRTKGFEGEVCKVLLLIVFSFQNVIIYRRLSTIGYKIKNLNAFNFWLNPACHTNRKMSAIPESSFLKEKGIYYYYNYSFSHRKRFIRVFNNI